ncbi:hypothetical protein KIL84_005308, partial [Mauremys mutica]
RKGARGVLGSRTGGQKRESHTFVKDATERMIKVMEEQRQMLQSFLVLQTEQIRARPPLQRIPCPPKLSASEQLRSLR